MISPPGAVAVTSSSSGKSRNDTTSEWYLAASSGNGRLSKSTPAVVLNRRRLAVHDLRRQLDCSTERGTQRLMSETYTEQRRPLGYSAHQIDTTAGGLRTPGAGREHYAGRVHRTYPLHVDLVVAAHLQLRTESAQRLYEGCR